VSLTVPRRLAAVLLDAGGTLISERESRAALYAREAEAAGLEVSERRMTELMAEAHAALPRELDGHFRYSTGWFGAFIRRVFVDGLGLDPRALPGVRSALFTRFADSATFRVAPGARELTRALRARGLKLAVVSNWSEALPGLLQGLGLADQLDLVTVSSLEGCEKPQPEIFLRTLARLGVEPRQTLHAGNDIERDVQGASAAGILGVLVGPPAPGCASVPHLTDLQRRIEESLP
jgi:REG-2-like HAD superfamily hydrolase